MSKKYKPMIDDMVAVDWLDTCRTTNQPLSKVRLYSTTNWGYVKRVNKLEIVLMSGLYHADGDDPDMDTVAIPMGCVTDIRKVRKVK